MLSACTDDEASTDSAAVTAGETEGDGQSPEVKAINMRFAGHYASDSNPESYIELRADGTFVNVQQSGQSDRKRTYTGTYVIEGNQLTLNINSRLGKQKSVVNQLENGVITSRRGGRWSKQ